jgi:hypothetical protein
MAEDMGHFRGGTFLDGNAVARRQRQVEGGNGSRHEERHIVFLGKHSNRIRPDLVGDVAVGGDPIGAHHHAADPPRF